MDGEIKREKKSKKERKKKRTSEKAWARNIKQEKKGGRKERENMISTGGKRRRRGNEKGREKAKRNRPTPHQRRHETDENEMERNPTRNQRGAAAHTKGKRGESLRSGLLSQIDNLLTWTLSNSERGKGKLLMLQAFCAESDLRNDRLLDLMR